MRGGRRGGGRGIQQRVRGGGRVRGDRRCRRRRCGSGVLRAAEKAAARAEPARAVVHLLKPRVQRDQHDEKDRDQQHGRTQGHHLQLQRHKAQHHGPAAGQRRGLPISAARIQALQPVHAQHHYRRVDHRRRARLRQLLVQPQKRRPVHRAQNLAGADGEQAERVPQRGVRLHPPPEPEVHALGATVCQGVCSAQAPAQAGRGGGVAVTRAQSAQKRVGWPRTGLGTCDCVFLFIYTLCDPTALPNAHAVSAASAKIRHTKTVKKMEAVTVAPVLPFSLAHKTTSMRPWRRSRPLPKYRQSSAKSPMRASERCTRRTSRAASRAAAAECPAAGVALGCRAPSASRSPSGRARWAVGPASPCDRSTGSRRA